MKKYTQFLKEKEDALLQVKQDIADKVDTAETSKDDLDNMEIKDKPNDAVLKDITAEIEMYEQQKLTVNKRIEEINKKIEVFSGEAKETKDPIIVKQLTDKVKSLTDSLSKFEEELKKFDKLISDSGLRKTQLEQTNK